MKLGESLSCDGRAFGTNGGSNCHEEAIRLHKHLELNRTRFPYPKVVAEPIMYCPSVRSMPFGPGPKRTMFVNP